MDPSWEGGGKEGGRGRDGGWHMGTLPRCLFYVSMDIGQGEVRCISIGINTKVRLCVRLAGGGLRSVWCAPPTILPLLPPLLCLSCQSIDTMSKGRHEDERLEPSLSPFPSPDIHIPFPP